MSLTVKPLVWRDSGSPHFPVHHGSFDGRDLYQVSRPRADAADPTHPWHLQVMLGRWWPQTVHSTLAAAQQAAQEQWEAFIRAAVEETPTRSSVNGAERAAACCPLCERAFSACECTAEEKDHWLESSAEDAP